MSIDPHTVIEGVGVAVTVASFLSNFVAPWTWVGKALHWLALNGPGIQSAAKAVAGEKK